MAVVVTELPYQVNKTTLIEKMAELVGAKRITDVSDIRDESDRTACGSWWRSSATARRIP